MANAKTLRALSPREGEGGPCVGGDAREASRERSAQERSTRSEGWREADLVRRNALRDLPDGPLSRPAPPAALPLGAAGVGRAPCP